MSKSLLSTYKDAIKEFSITDEMLVSPEQKAGYVQTQVVEQKTILNRLLFDYATAVSKRDEAKDDLSADAHQGQVAKYAGDIKQTSNTLQKNLALLEELKKEHSELNED